MFFSYDHEDGIEFHETAEEAKARAEKALDMDRDVAEDGWDDNVTDICWGEVKGRVVETMRRPTTPEDNTDCEEWVDYAMQDTPNPGADRAAHLVRGTVEPVVGQSKLKTGQ